MGVPCTMGSEKMVIMPRRHAAMHDRNGSTLITGHYKGKLCATDLPNGLIRNRRSARLDQSAGFHL